MESKMIKELAEIMKANDVCRLDIEENHCKISMERGGPVYVQSEALPQSVEILPEKQEPAEHYIEIKSPMVGVFYSAKAPGEKDFVSVGDQVQKGDVLCIIEAMKLMNDITAEHSGTVAEICVANGDIVEYGQVLFKLK